MTVKDKNPNDWKKRPARIPSLDTSVLQTKTCKTLIGVLKQARTITKNGTKECKEINRQIELCVNAHHKALRKIKPKDPGVEVLQPSTFNGRYKVNL